MVVADGSGLPIGCHVGSANPFESTLTEKVLDTIRVPRAGRGRPRTKPKRLIADKAYDNNKLRRSMKKRGIDFIVPALRLRVTKVQDGRKLRRYKRRWKIERVFAWIDSWRRLTVRWDHLFTIYQGFVQLAIMMIVLRRL